MTTIAYRDGVIAADTGVMCGGSKVSHTRKIARNKWGALAGAAGSAGYCHAFLKWFLDGNEMVNAPEAKRDDKGTDMAMIIKRNGEVECFDPHGRYPEKAAYHVLGSGMPEAMGCMWKGGSAQDAVRAAMAHDNGTFGDLEWYSHDSEEIGIWEDPSTEATISSSSRDREPVRR